MVRRTKEEAQATRHRLLDAAEALFQSQGVSRTSLQDIARRAGTTRGAVYWHFKDKADLFNAMMERVILPIESSFTDDGDAENAASGAAHPVDAIRHATVQALRTIATDPQTRRVIEVATQKVEYVDELQAVRLRHLAGRQTFLVYVEKGLGKAAQAQGLTLAVPAMGAARGLHALIDGLIQNWLLDPELFDLVTLGQSVTDIYLKGLGFTDAPEPASAAGPA